MRLETYTLLPDSPRVIFIGVPIACCGAYTL